jgi:hypothetical protein
MSQNIDIKVERNTSHALVLGVFLCYNINNGDTK